MTGNIYNVPTNRSAACRWDESHLMCAVIREGIMMNKRECGCYEGCAISILRTVYSRYHQMADFGPDLDQVMVLSGPMTNPINLREWIFMEHFPGGRSYRQQVLLFQLIRQ